MGGKSYRDPRVKCEMKDSWTWSESASVKDTECLKAMSKTMLEMITVTAFSGIHDKDRLIYECSSGM